MCAVKQGIAMQTTCIRSFTTLDQDRKLQCDKHRTHPEMILAKNAVRRRTTLFANRLQSHNKCTTRQFEKGPYQDLVSMWLSPDLPSFKEVGFGTKADVSGMYPPFPFESWQNFIVGVSEMLEECFLNYVSSTLLQPVGERLYSGLVSSSWRQLEDIAKQKP